MDELENQYEDYKNTFKINLPKPGKWKMEWCGASVVWCPDASVKIPNWFWRKMQYLILGIKWVKK